MLVCRPFCSTSKMCLLSRHLRSLYPRAMLQPRLLHVQPRLRVLRLSFYLSLRRSRMGPRLLHRLRYHYLHLAATRAHGAHSRRPCHRRSSRLLIALSADSSTVCCTPCCCSLLPLVRRQLGSCLMGKASGGVTIELPPDYRLQALSAQGPFLRRRDRQSCCSPQRLRCPLLSFAHSAAQPLLHRSLTLPAPPICEHTQMWRRHSPVGTPPRRLLRRRILLAR